MIIKDISFIVKIYTPMLPILCPSSDLSTETTLKLAAKERPKICLNLKLWKSLK